METVSKKDFSHKFFSKELYFQNLKRSRVVGIGFLIAILVLNCLWGIGSAWSSSQYKTKEVVITGGNIAPLYFMIFVLGIAMAYDAFSFQFKRKTSDFFHTLPQTRLCVFLTFTLSIFTWILLTLVATFLSCALIWSAFELYSVDWSALFPMIAGAFSSCAVVSGVVSLAIMISGTGSSCAVYIVSLFVAPRAILNVFISFFGLYKHTILIDHTWLKYFVGMERTYMFSVFNTAENKMGYFENPSFTISLLIEAFILFALSGIIFVKRKSEAASTPFLYKPVHIALRTAIILSILSLTSILYSLTSILYINYFIIFLSLLLHFIFDLISLKNAKKALTSLVWFLLPVGLCFLFSGSVTLSGKLFDFFGPKESNVVAVSIHSSKIKEYYDSLNFNEFNLNLWTTDEDAIKGALNALEESGKERAYYFDEAEHYSHDSLIIKFKTKLGKEHFRRIIFSKENYTALIKGIKAEEENREKLTLPNWNLINNTELYVYIQNEELSKEIYDKFCEEYNALSAEKQAKSEAVRNVIYISFSSDEKEYMFYLDLESFPKTTSLIFNTNAQNALERAKQFKTKIKDILENDNQKDYLRVVSATYNQHFDLYIENSVELDNFYNSLDVYALSDKSDIKKQYYVILGVDYYILSLDQNVISALREL